MSHIQYSINEEQAMQIDALAAKANLSPHQILTIALNNLASEMGCAGQAAAQPLISATSPMGLDMSAETELLRAEARASNPGFNLKKGRPKIDGVAYQDALRDAW